jgi:uncharacterized protein (DUF2062 family)
VRYLWQKIKNIMAKELCPNRMAISFSLALFVAFSPLIGLHTVMIILFCWILSLNIPFVLMLSTLVHNPWTTIPIYYLDYLVGVRIMPYVPFIPTQNPLHIDRLVSYVSHYITIPNFSLWTFLVGGNIFALAIGAITYPVVFYIMYFWAKKTETADVP